MPRGFGFIVDIFVIIYSSYTTFMGVDGDSWEDHGHPLVIKPAT
jgi:hypothetical protein